MDQSVLLQAHIHKCAKICNIGDYAGHYHPNFQVFYGFYAVFELKYFNAEELAELTRQRADELKQRGQVVLEEQKARVGKVIDAAKTPGEAKDEKPAPKKSTKKAEGKA